ncbi:lysine-rich nucleolar protein 1 [Sphaerodactylus townsendi]|uniref:Uncharacterized protein n=1 Tax=Sphaerodactylus townsendi TaxID=933632 RepID=A0ACB8FLI5_9SAUR|nr:lysine-rich nucleolar protein 1 [Sphaerodactylus townsendi]XP_048348906.1 lysine-rich nucleolar protein 1 [Sphaerodactylus townsendi]
MIIKDAKKYSSEETGQKKNKPKRATRKPLVIIEDDDETQISLPSRAKGGKKKRSAEGNNPKERKKKNWKSTLENAASIDLPIVTQSCSDSKSINEAEKLPKALKKKRKRHSCRQDGNPELLSQGQTTECQEANLLVGKKRRRNVADTCVEFTASPTKRKKKKKCKLAGSVSPSHGEDDYSRNYLSPTMETVSRERMLSDRKQTLIQTAGSKGKSRPMCCLASTDSHGPRNGVLKRVAADPVQEENSCKRDHKDTAHILKKKRQATEQKKKRKKRPKEKEVDSILTSVGDQENHPAKPLRKTKSEGGKQEETGLIQNSEGDRKSLKKKKIYPKVTDHHPPLAEDNEDACDREEKAAAKRAKKKAKKSKKEQDQEVELKNGHLRERKEKQRDATKRKSGRSEGPEETPSSKQAKVKKEVQETEDEIQVVAVKKGNCDEVRIDKLRRRALQEEIDRESSKTETIKEEDDSDHCFGQWSTATFDSAEQKSKFLKLLGGFKEGAAPTREWPSKARQRNMALDRHGEEKLQQGLQAEFEKAMDWKQRRGTGLGFQPAPQKRVCIDKYASKSIKFEN